MACMYVIVPRANVYCLVSLGVGRCRGAQCEIPLKISALSSSAIRAGRGGARGPGGGEVAQAPCSGIPYMATKTHVLCRTAAIGRARLKRGRGASRTSLVYIHRRPRSATFHEESSS